MTDALKTYFKSKTGAAPLAAFRILFGLMMFISIVRFWLNGWIEKLYIEPQFFFKYYGFEFVKPLGVYTYLLFIICGIAALGVALGYKYRISIALFFLSFTYIELMDLTTYLNHYYFISILSFVMFFLPAGDYFSLDTYFKPHSSSEYIPRWNTDIIKVLLSMVYFYAGLAKLNTDWLFNAMPLSIWLPSSYDIPLLGNLLQEKWAIYLFSWAGAFYDICIPFLLFYRPTRLFGFSLVVIFHILTGMLFPIGMFPYIMIISSTIFFDEKWHRLFLEKLSSLFRIPKNFFNNNHFREESLNNTSKIKLGFLAFFLIFQLSFPFRYLLYPGELFWTEEGFRFSWRVMLIEKAGYISFEILEPSSDTRFKIDNSEFLTSFQEKQMSTQPDMILQFAGFLKKHFEGQGYKDLEVYADSHVALNGRASRPYISPEVNLAAIKDSFQPKTWILHFDDEIRGL